MKENKNSVVQWAGEQLLHRVLRGSGVQVWQTPALLECLPLVWPSFGGRVVKRVPHHRLKLSRVDLTLWKCEDIECYQKKKSKKHKKRKKQLPFSSAFSLSESSILKRNFFKLISQHWRKKRKLKMALEQENHVYLNGPVFVINVLTLTTHLISHPNINVKNRILALKANVATTQIRPAAAQHMCHSSHHDYTNFLTNC